MRDMAGEDTREEVVSIDAEIRGLIPGYLSNRQMDLTGIRAALAVADHEAIRIIGHGMKGSGGAYGFDAVSAIGACLEEAACARDRPAIEAAATALADYLRRLRVDYVK